MQRIAMGWLVYRLTNSPFMLGAVGFAGQIPTFLLAPLGGVFADRWDRRRVLVVTQTLAMVQALVLSVLVLTGTAVIWHLFVLSMFLGVINAWDMPVRQSFMLEMVEEKEDLSNAIALNSSMVNSARLLGPSLAGILIAAVGEGTCFLLNGVSYLAVIAALLAMNVTAKASPRQGSAGLERFDRRIPLRIRFCSHLVSAPAPGAREPDGNALCGAHAYVCQGDPARRAAYPGFSDGSLRRRGAGGCGVSGVKEKRARAGENHLYSGKPFRIGSDRAFLCLGFWGFR